ncbi:hypothetical protein Forpe1208_v011442 [Fusarium oxysporum f. sp. rapae]|uniref:Fungal lipase-type domain-containing protein n=1 Tax=Fusarium oxysporum f. sp. rapae TaxID=485398 RepID=A0A8J5U496_FUSOX|nr:hypothetical protein Forpe1208_v011442 [Fusarium oxysporum f. sp. rapae]
MVRTETLLSEYINFSDQNAGLSDAELTNKELMFYGAAAVSHLCNEQEQGINIDENLHQSERFRFVRELDIISSIYSIAPISKKAGIKSTPPVIAWSDRLQTIFLGFCCTRDMNDVRSDLDVRLATSDDIGSRFHKGFWNRSEEFVPLVEWLMKRYKLVVCGHSFGGALATISSYLAMVSHEPVPNAWEERPGGISIITFGAPSCMVAEPRGTTVSFQMNLSGNFHHVINPHDYVPFALNDSSRKFKQSFDALRTPLGNLSPTIQMLWPILEYFLDLLLQNTGKFCHFGCMYSIAAEVPGIQNCVQTLRVNDIPQIPSAGQVDQYHKMSHYFHCVKNSVGARLTQQASSELHHAVSDVSSMILPMPRTVTSCSCVVHSDHLIVSLDVDTPVMQYLLKGATFRSDTREVPLTILGFPTKSDHYQTSVKLEYRIKANDPFGDIGKASIAIQNGITFHDIFGRSTDINVDTVRSMSLDRASLPATFESIRLAMIRALVAQMSKVQALRTDNTSRDAHPTEEVMAIVDNIKAVVGCIDGLVSDASPHLVFSRVGHAFTILKVLWPKDFEIGSDFHASMPGAYEDEESETGLLHDIPAACPRVLRRLITDMVLSQNDPGITRAQLSVESWESAKRPTLTNQFKKVPTFAGALKTFSHDLYHRSTDPARRTAQAVSQFQDVMGVIQFCHLVIITQLDAPYEWYCKSTEGHRITSAALGALPSYFSGASLFSRVVALGLGATSAAGLGVTGGVAMLFASTKFIGHLLNRHKQHLDLSFPGVLAITLQALGLPIAESDDIVEKTLLDRVKQDIARSHALETIEKWRVKLEEGLKDYPGVKTNQWCITPTFFWPKWLFSVAQVAQLRIQLSNKICIGVQGSTEAGKSQMLTVLTGASEDYFKPGSSSLCRTLGIQSYDSSNLGAIFLDSPGFDDQKPEIKYMADVFQELFAIVIIVIPMERTRSEATESALRIAIKLLRDQEDKRPLRILLSQADGLDHHRNNKQRFKDTLRDVKEQFMSRFRQELGENFTTFRQQPFHDGIVCKSETLEDIVKPFSTHAQMTLDGISALADSPPKTPCKIERESHFENLCELADAGEIWDIESLRSWLRDLSPSSVPVSSGRVRVYCD